MFYLCICLSIIKEIMEIGIPTRATYVARAHIGPCLLFLTLTLHLLHISGRIWLALLSFASCMSFGISTISSLHTQQTRCWMEKWLHRVRVLLGCNKTEMHLGGHLSLDTSPNHPLCAAADHTGPWPSPWALEGVG